MNLQDLSAPPTHSQLSLGLSGGEVADAWRGRVGQWGRGTKKKSLIRGLSHWVCRVNPYASPSVVLLPSDITVQGLAAVEATEGLDSICLIPLCKE